jgi:hypothetical protein
MEAAGHGASCGTSKKTGVVAVVAIITPFERLLKRQLCSAVPLLTQSISSTCLAKW